MVEADNLFDFFYHAQAAEGVQGFILRSLKHQSLVGALQDLGHPAAGEIAFGAGMGRDVTLTVQGVG